LQEQFEDTKGVIRSRRSEKNRQHGCLCNCRKAKQRSTKLY